MWIQVTVDLKHSGKKLQLVVMRAQTCKPSTLDAEAGAL